MAVKQLMLPGELVKKDNELIRSKTDVNNKTTARLLACLVSQLQDTDADFKDEYTLNIRQQLPIFQDTDGRQTNQIRVACRELAHAKVWIDKNEPNKKGTDDDFDIIPYFSKLSYRGGKLYAKFNPEMKKFLLELKAFFTQYNLIEYLSLPSIYSQKLFELLKSFEGGNKKGFVEFALKDLHDYLDTPDSFRSDFRNFRIRILEKAHKDINKTSLEFAWEPIKSGRAVTAVRFLFRDKMREKIEKKKELDKDNKNKSIHNDMYRSAVFCAKQKNGICEGQPNNTTCDMCMKMILPDVKRKIEKEKEK